VRSSRRKNNPRVGDFYDEQRKDASLHYHIVVIERIFVEITEFGVASGACCDLQISRTNTYQKGGLEEARDSMPCHEVKPLDRQRPLILLIGTCREFDGFDVECESMAGFEKEPEGDVPTVAHGEG
jgi:hypothetical protein